MNARMPLRVDKNTRTICGKSGDLELHHISQEPERYSKHTRDRPLSGSSRRRILRSPPARDEP